MNNGKLILNGILELISPLHIGSGENNSTDLDIIKDSDGLPYIAFTSFIGAIRHELNNGFDRKEEELNHVFGYADDEHSRGSLITGNDLYLEQNSKCEVVTRDGIKIDLKSGLVIEGAKYDYQIVDKGAGFKFSLEASYRNDAHRLELLKYFKTIIQMINENMADSQIFGLRIGAKTNNGLGKIHLLNPQIVEYDFAKQEDIIAWLSRADGKNIAVNDLIPFERQENDLVIDSFFDLKTSLIQRSYNDDPAMPDASHMQSNNKNILTGSGTKGALTARARRIVNTIWKKDSATDKEEFLNTLLGFVDNENNGKDAIKAKLQIEERELPSYVAELQSRIKIDRFTGGTINGALFDSMPLFNRKEFGESTDLSKKTRITIKVVNCEESEAGLMLLVLKDLWTGDLAIGGEKGIGRGVFSGISASIKYHKEAIELKQGLENLAQLQKYVDALVEKAGGKK